MARRRRLSFEGVAEPVAIGETARAILHKTVDDGVADLEMAKAIRLDLIEPDPDQPRKHFDEAALRELAESIRKHGVLQPITVEWVQERERFKIISGERRWRAARVVAEEQPEGENAPLGRPARIPAIVRNPGALGRYAQQLVENEHRRDYSDVERAFAYERLKEMLGVSWDELAGRLGLSKGRIHQIRRTKNRLAPAVQRDVSEGRLTGRHGLYLVPLAEPVQEAIAEAVKRDGLTHRQTQRLVQRVRARLPDAGVIDAGTGEAPRTASADNRTGQEPRTARGAGRSRAALATVVEEAVAEVRALRPEIPRGRRGDLDRALAHVRQLVQLDLAPPADEAERARLADALDELIAWAGKVRGEFGSGTV